MEKLKETIPGFHDTPKRLRDFNTVVEQDPLGRAKEAKQEIEFIKAHAELAERLVRMQRNGELPVRVTHNDTKFNNVLIDTDTGEAICVIDLDTRCVLETGIKQPARRNAAKRRRITAEPRRKRNFIT